MGEILNDLKVIWIYFELKYKISQRAPIPKTKVLNTVISVATFFSHFLRILMFINLDSPWNQNIIFNLEFTEL